MTSATSRTQNPLPLIGRPETRYDAREKVTGRALYAADMPVANPLYAWLVTSTIARGRIVSMELADAMAVPGVVEIVTHENAPTVGRTSLATGYSTSAMPLVGPEIHHDGQIIAIVLGESLEAAREAGCRIRAIYAETPSATTLDSAGTTEILWSDANKNYHDRQTGDVHAALVRSPVTVDQTYRTPTQHHNAMELFSTTAQWDGDGLVLYEPSQFVAGLQSKVAQQLGIDPSRVRVVNPYVGGGFGGKLTATPRTAIIAALALRWRRPVKLVATRTQGFALSRFRAETRHHIRLGADSDGKLTAYEHEAWELTSRADPYANAGVHGTVETYAAPNIRTRVHVVHSDHATPGFMRAPGEMPYMFALESAMDELAEKLHIDPIELRRINDTARSPVDNARFTSRSLMKCFDEAAARFDWSRRNPTPGAVREGEWLIGLGCAAASFPVWNMGSSARVRLSATGNVRVELAAHDLGTGAYTTIAQVTSQLLGVPREKVDVRLGDSDLPPGQMAGGSMQTASTIPAIQMACDRIVARLGGKMPAIHELAAAFRTIGVGQIEEYAEYRPFGGGSFFGRTRLGAEETAEQVLVYAFGAQFAEVRINIRTREIRAPRITGAFAAGRILNERMARAQYQGGMIWGVGSALHEATEIDQKRGRFVNANFAEYLVPVNADIRDVDVIIVPEEDTEVNPAGVKGIGEIGVVGMAAAIANAVYNATGIRVRDLPISIDKVLAGAS